MVKRRPKPEIHNLDALREAREAHLVWLKHPTDETAAAYVRARRRWLTVSGRQAVTHLPEELVIGQ